MKTRESKQRSLRLLEAQIKKLNNKKRLLEDDINSDSAKGIIVELKNCKFIIKDSFEIRILPSKIAEKLIISHGRGSYHFSITIGPNITIECSDGTYSLYCYSRESNYVEKLLKFLHSVGVPESNLNITYFDKQINDLKDEIHSVEQDRDAMINSINQIWKQ